MSLGLSDVHDLEARFKALDRIAARPRAELMGDEAGVAEIRDGIGNKTVVDLLRIVDLRSAGHAGHMDVADLVKIVPQIARQVAIGDLYVIAIKKDLHPG